MPDTDPPPAEMITLHVHQHDLEQPCPPDCPHAGTEHDRDTSLAEWYGYSSDSPAPTQENPMPEQPAAEHDPNPETRALAWIDEHAGALTLPAGYRPARAFSGWLQGSGYIVHVDTDGRIRHANPHEHDAACQVLDRAVAQLGIPAPTHYQPQENPMHDQPPNPVPPPLAEPTTLAERAAAASVPTPTDEQHHEAGAFARSVLTERLEAAREALAGTIDYLQVYQDQADAEQLVVQKLETAIADLDKAAER